MKSRIISGIIITIIAAIFIVSGGIPFYVGVLALSFIAYKELVNLKKTNEEDYPTFIKIIGLICVALMCILFNTKVMFLDINFMVYIILSLLVLFVPTIIYKDKYTVEKAFKLFSIVTFIGISFTSITNIYNYDIKYFVLLILIATMTDIFALFGGKLFGKHHFTDISPNKTIEGCISGTLLSVIISIVYYSLSINKITLIVVIMLILLSITGQVGDLFFSKIKREYKIKDFSNLIPGHGGILDRLDSLIFISYAFVIIMQFA